MNLSRIAVNECAPTARNRAVPLEEVSPFCALRGGLRLPLGEDDESLEYLRECLEIGKHSADFTHAASAYSRLLRAYRCLSDLLGRTDTHLIVLCYSAALFLSVVLERAGFRKCVR